MDFKEMLSGVSQSAGRAWERVRSLTRANRILAASLFLVLSVGLIVWARVGFTLDFGRLFAGTVFTSPTAVLRAELRDRLDSGGVEYNLIWATNTDSFYALYGIDVECLPEASPGDRNNQFYADIKAKGYDHGTLKDSNLPGAGWYYITSGYGNVRVELGALQTPVSFRIVCRASSTQAQGVRLDSATWYSNTICLPPERVISELPPGTSPDPNRCQEKPGGIGVPSPLTRAGTTTTTGGTTTGGTTTGGTTTGGTTTGSVSAGGAARPAPVAGTPATCDQLGGSCTASGSAGVEVMGTCPGGQKCRAEKKAPWTYCDYGTYSCQPGPASMVAEAQTAVGPTDFSAPQCGATTCIPGNCRKWEGTSTTDWKPISIPAGVPACEPLSLINGALFPGYVGPELKPPPITHPAQNFYTTGERMPNCFVYVNDSSPDPNIGEMTDTTVPEAKAGAPGKKLYMGGYVVNNCPWEVHFVFQVDLSTKASFAQGAGSRMCGDTASSGLVKFDMPDGFDFPSCWNNSLAATPANCSRKFKFEFNLDAFTCGSAGVTLAVWHRTNGGKPGGENVTAERFDFPSVNSSLNWGKDCTGAASERAPKCGTTGPSTSTAPNVCKASPLPAPATLTAKCGTTSNVLTWNTATNACEVGILRGDNTTSLSFVTTGVPAFPGTTWTDTTVQAGHTYTYVVKNHPSVRSNPVTCKDGVLISPSPSPSTSVTTSPRPTLTPTPGPTATRTPGPTATATRTPGPTTPTPTAVITPPLPGNQLQCAPLAQTVGINQAASIQAFGGTGSYLFDSSDGVLTPADNARVVVRYSTPGPHTVMLADGQTTVQCSINVVTSPDNADPDDDDDTIPDTVECPNFAACPDSDNDGIPDYLDTDSDNDGIPDRTDPNRTVRNVTSGAGNPGTVQTGPAEATLFALVISALVSLLYVSYAHSPLYRRREAEKVSEDQPPMDFRI